MAKTVKKKLVRGNLRKPIEPPAPAKKPRDYILTVKITPELDYEIDANDAPCPLENEQDFVDYLEEYFQMLRDIESEESCPIENDDEDWEK